MKIVVQKYGGSSLATVDAINSVARKIVDRKREGCNLVVVVSAMGETTDRLMGLVRKVAPAPPRRELDALLATGEQVSTALLSMAIHNQGEEAVSLTGGQSGIISNDVHSNARILEIRPYRVHQELARDKIVVVAGFQGIDHQQEVTTLGRGGSDTTAVALAAALDTQYCEIYTDVEGVFSANPRIVPKAQRLELIRHSEMEELAWQGARVLKAEAVEFARDNKVSIRVLSTFGGNHTTLIDAESLDAEDRHWIPQRSEIVGVAGRNDLIRLSINAPRAHSPLLKDLFDCIARYDLVFGNLSGGLKPCELFLSTEEIPDVAAFACDIKERFAKTVRISEILGGVSLVGFGLGSRPAALLEAMTVIDEFGFEIITSFTSRESLTFVMPLLQVDEAVRALHDVFIEGEYAMLELAEAGFTG